MPENNYWEFTQRPMINKAMASLDGILSGILMDKVINQKEFNELKAWVDAHVELIGIYPFKEFADRINALGEGTLPIDEALDDMRWLISKNKLKNEYYDGYTMGLQTLQGICHGILADGVIKDSEIIGLEEWIEENDHLANYYPYDEVRSLLLTILKDGIIDDDERKQLKALFNEFVTIQDNQVRKKVESDLTDVKKISGLCTSDPVVTFKESTFVITGELQRGDRDDLINHIESFGGIYRKSVSGRTDYLVVGDSGNPAWAFACYGRKVEKALHLRKAGHNITIVHEFDFWDILEDHL